MTDKPVDRVRLRSGIQTINGITGETGPLYSEYVLAEHYDALRARVAELEAAGRAVLKCNDQVCAFDHVGCSTQCRADEMMHAALRDVPSAGGGQS